MNKTGYCWYLAINSEKGIGFRDKYGLFNRVTSRSANWKFGIEWLLSYASCIRSKILADIKMTEINL